jgi:shikimate 5-dehydrogenase
MKGVGGGDAVAKVVPWAELPSSAFAYDVVYNPPETPFLRRAAERGLVRKGGLGMLVGQAARAFSLWFDQEAPVERMQSAAHRAIFPDES